MGSIEWTEAHEQLHAVMKRELEAMRQLLANMSLEEQFILRKDQRYWGSMMEERTHLVEQLSALRQDRLSVTEKLESQAEHPNVSLEELLPPQDTNSWEILSLRDQMLTLLDRMNLQSSRNEMLYHLVHASASPQLSPQKKAKITLATLPPEDYKDRDEQ